MRCRAVRPRRATGRAADPLAVASSLDVFAVCLAAGMAVPTAAAATAASAPPRLARLLRRTADLLTLGADPAAAWSPPPDLSGASLDIHTQALLRLAGGQRVRVPRSPTASLNSPDNAAAMPRTPPRRPPSAPRC
ncbi:hypothetical protein I553_3777 [Mycobacterium xenopi 4042]|uniref:Uncharacterized protein n=1 Tax=Mycobacterium xenopi 4042 TaxID=1299334 RepID=X8BE45_MYCXE|nr:hypothetical protein I553_3777 [Mycobacterium xenopi 4042]